jgi:hypothetical protein
MFIALSTDNSTKIRVNVMHIVSYGPGSDLYQKQRTTIHMVNGDHIHVMETPDQIDRALAPPQPYEEPKKEEPKKSHDEDSDYMFHYGQY